MGWKLDGFSRALRGLCVSVFLKVRAGKAACFVALFLKHRVTEAQREGGGGAWNAIFWRMKDELAMNLMLEGVMNVDAEGKLFPRHLILKGCDQVEGAWSSPVYDGCLEIRVESR